MVKWVHVSSTNQQSPAGANQQINIFNQQINKGKRSGPNKQGPEGRINNNPVSCAYKRSNK
jgi:hypothetical protein